MADDLNPETATASWARMMTQRCVTGVALTTECNDQVGTEIETERLPHIEKTLLYKLAEHPHRTWRKIQIGLLDQTREPRFWTPNCPPSDRLGGLIYQIRDQSSSAPAEKPEMVTPEDQMMVVKLLALQQNIYRECEQNGVFSENINDPPPEEFKKWRHALAHVLEHRLKTNPSPGQLFPGGNPAP